jgi:hypothetical protein
VIAMMQITQVFEVRLAMPVFLLFIWSPLAMAWWNGICGGGAGAERSQASEGQMQAHPTRHPAICGCAT